jgi:flavin-dependent dehydrogenase
MTTEPFEVAVVGAGPAGATFARFLALSKPDVRIALIDGQTRERSKVCGGLLSPDAQKVLASFDMTLPKEVLADPQIFAV